MSRPPRKVRPFSVEPIEALFPDQCFQEIGRGGHTTVKYLERPNASVIGRAVGVDGKTVRIWRTYGLDQWSADRAAVALGFHPWQLWPEWFADENEASKREVAANRAGPSGPGIEATAVAAAASPRSEIDNTHRRAS